ncbi:7721_t:CDS:2 [Scutellospora calospora]|uniref:7721_t:CDS:1 n=1 Tax=Scutellospora calospora TaxID=85575 RepID=A0ACA9N169_9GLOM|nr:7721_t:CDS:2 [Scutellospora calospora]
METNIQKEFNRVKVRIVILSNENKNIQKIVTRINDIIDTDYVKYDFSTIEDHKYYYTVKVLYSLYKETIFYDNKCKNIVIKVDIVFNNTTFLSLMIYDDKTNEPIEIFI